MQTRRIAKIERLRGVGRETLRFFIRAPSRRGRWIWFDRGEVPEFEGDHAWFECERVKGGWAVRRQVETPPWAR
jgi:hypothetical protein